MQKIGTKEVDVTYCPVCGKSFTRLTRPKAKNVDGIIVTITRFKCPKCGISIEDTRSNRCSDCMIMCADNMALQVHRYQGCQSGTHT